MKRAIATTSGLLLLAGRHSVAAVECYSCTDDALNSFTGDANCWVPNANTATTTCTDGTQRCSESMTFLDGWPQSVARGCETILLDPLDDTPGETTNAITCDNALTEFRNFFDGSYPSGAAEFASTTCQSDCVTASCNSRIALTQLRVCDPTQNTANSVTKWCDFTTGAWMCRNAYGGGAATANVDCTLTTVSTLTAADTFTPISCVQCNSETDAGCWAATAATACENENYVSCSAETVVTYNKETGDKLRESVVRGCSLTNADLETSGIPVFDQCNWSRNEEQDQAEFGVEKELAAGRWANELQLNCVSRCDPGVVGANCNYVPNGKLADDIENPLVCYHLDVTGDAAVGTTSTISGLEVCAPGVTSCYSEVTYLVRGSQHYVYDPMADTKRVQILSHKRGCGIAAAEGCAMDATFSASDNVGDLDVKKYTCSETCNEADGCNGYNWPARPKCLQDGMSESRLGYQHVVLACSTPAHEACSVQEYNLINDGSKYQKFVEDHVVTNDANNANLGFSTQVRRGCVIDAEQIPTGCEKSGARETDTLYFGDDSLFFENCNFTCVNDGCNFGTGYSGSAGVVASVVALLLAVIAN